MPSPNNSTTAIAILAQAPIPGLAQPRFIPNLGENDAAALQQRLTEQTVATALAAATGPVTVWAAPDASHDSFLTMVTQKPITLKGQPAGDLGHRMLVAATAAQGPVIIVDTDCPALSTMHLRSAARALSEGADVFLMPNEAGGYCLIGLRQAVPAIFANIPWGTPAVLSETRKRVISSKLMLNEVPPLWDITGSDGLNRLAREIPDLTLTPSE